MSSALYLVEEEQAKLLEKSLKKEIYNIIKQKIDKTKNIDELEALVDSIANLKITKKVKKEVKYVITKEWANCNVCNGGIGCNICMKDKFTINTCSKCKTEDVCFNYEGNFRVIVEVKNRVED